MFNNYKNHTFFLLCALVLGTLIVTLIQVPYYNQHSQQDMNYSYTDTSSDNNDSSQVTYTSQATQDRCIDSSLHIENSSKILCPEHFKAHADKLMTSTWQQLDTNAGITIADCNEFLCAYGTQFKAEIEKSNKQKIKRHGPVSEQTKALVHEILRDFDIDPRFITLVKYNGQGSPAAADDYTMYIDEDNLKTFCPEAQRFVIAHEISHYKNKDHSFESALNNLIDNRSKLQKRCIHTFAHSTELRADINAMLKGPEYTKGGIAFFQELIYRYGDDDSSTHPRPSERLKIAQEMDAMHTQQAQAYPIHALVA